MARKPKPFQCDEESLKQLTRLSKSRKAHPRLARRALMIIYLHKQIPIKDIAQALGERPNTVIMWRERFIKGGIEGLNDLKRSGKPVIYGEEFKQRVLQKLTEDPPEGYSHWDGPRLAEALNTSTYAIWRVLRNEKIKFPRRHNREKVESLKLQREQRQEKAKPQRVTADEDETQDSDNRANQTPTRTYSEENSRTVEAKLEPVSDLTDRSGEEKARVDR